MAKYNIKTKYLIIYMVLIVFSGFLVICRWINHIEPYVKILPEYVLSHITNFALCLMLLLIIGYIILMCGGKVKAVTIIAIVIVVINIVYECFLPFLNTSDIVDAIFGVCGTVVAYVYLMILKRNGLTVK